MHRAGEILQERGPTSLIRYEGGKSNQFTTTLCPYIVYVSQGSQSTLPVLKFLSRRIGRTVYLFGQVTRRISLSFSGLSHENGPTQASCSTVTRICTPSSRSKNLRNGTLTCADDGDKDEFLSGGTPWCAWQCRGGATACSEDRIEDENALQKV